VRAWCQRMRAQQCDVIWTGDGMFGPEDEWVCELKFPWVKVEGYGVWMSYVRGCWVEPHRS
jgi:hypothetical protein